MNLFLFLNKVTQKGLLAYMYLCTVWGQRRRKREKYVWAHKPIPFNLLASIVLGNSRIWQKEDLCLSRPHSQQRLWEVFLNQTRYSPCFVHFIFYIRLHLTITFSNLADAFIQSDLQERALQKVYRSMIINNKIAPKTLRAAKTWSIHCEKQISANG